jgi:hypothetical protein
MYRLHRRDDKATLTASRCSPRQERTQANRHQRHVHNERDVPIE